MNSQIIKSFSLVLLIGVVAVSKAIAQDGTQTRSITSDDFSNKRPPAKAASTKGKATPKRKRQTYKFLRAEKQSRNTRPPASKTAQVKTVEIGVTMWRLRPPQEGETGHLLPVIDDDKKHRMWLAERVKLDTIFAAGDRVRFAVESTEPGYLYIFDREMHADGSRGAPYMIFPESGFDDNAIGPGIIVDIPDGGEEMPYFRVNPKDANYAGEMLTVIISPKPLEGLEIDNAGRLASSTKLNELELGSDAEVFSRDDDDDKFLSKVEAEAACGSKARKGADGTAAKPCGVRTRQLTRDEPFPQAIYRVKAVFGQPAVAFVKLAAK